MGRLRNLSPQRRVALMSVGAAVLLVGLKLSVGLATHSLGLVSEAIHSGVDLVAALLTFFAVSVSTRPADSSHPYGHGKAEHITALAEAACLIGASLLIAIRAIERLTGSSDVTVNATWYAFATVGVVIAIDVSRVSASWRTARRHSSAALSANAVHFASDLVGSIAVLAGLLLARGGHPNGDSIAALFVAGLVLAAATRLILVNVDVLMDRAPAAAEAAARAAIEGLEPPVELRRLRMRQAGGRQFADVVIGVPSIAPVGQGHAAADAVEAALEAALPGSDVVVHVEPQAGATVHDRAHIAALAVPGVREVHNLAIVDVDGRTELSLHLKLPGDMPLEDAHEVAEQVERAIIAATPEVDAVLTHIEPIDQPALGSEIQRSEIALDTNTVEQIVREIAGSAPREIRFLGTTTGVVVFLTLALGPGTSLADAHARASAIEERIRRELPAIHDVIVHTEP